MRRSIKIALISAGALAGVAAGAVAVQRAIDSHPPPVAAAAVPRTWRAAREGPGHVAHLAKNVKCGECHAIAEESFQSPQILPCDRCHQQSTAPLHTQRLEGSPECLGCHAFVPDPKIEPWSCARCHVGGNADEAPVVRVHGDQACSTCHAPHGTPSTTPADCGGCHREVHVAHGANPVAPQACLVCHSVHQPREVAKERCATCHRDTPPVILPTATFAGHTACTSCHANHRPEAPIKACRSCHVEPRIAAAVEREGHGRCDSCHAPHDARRSALASCVRCHEGASVSHRARTASTASALRAIVEPGALGAEACASCHPPHPREELHVTAPRSGPHDSARPCSSCHRGAGDDRALHAGGLLCKSCHVAHEFSSIPRGDAICGRCHLAEAERTSASLGHRACSSCHLNAAHAPTEDPRRCETCHEGQAHTLTRGHVDCSGCHEPHRGAVQVACASCHTREASTKHGHRVEGGCTTCHRPHGPEGVETPPSCTTCHATAKAAGLHAIEGHGVCADCHGAHEPGPRSDRAACTRCHLDRAEHEPKAKTCATCHPFR